MNPRRLLVAISGASAPVYGVRTLQLLQELEDVETHLIVTRAAAQTLKIEMGMRREEVWGLADVHYREDDIAAAPASGSFLTLGMIVAPCSVNTMSCIAGGVTKDLVTRAADVTLKEKRPLVLMVRETPLHLGHLRRMVELVEIGATIAPPIPAFYQRPESIEDLVDHSVGRALDAMGVHLDSARRWKS